MVGESDVDDFSAGPGASLCKCAGGEVSGSDMDACNFGVERGSIRRRLDASEEEGDVRNVGMDIERRIFWVSGLSCK